MTLTIAMRMLVEKKSRFALTFIGIAALFFLSAAQIGLLVGWCKTTSAIVRHAGVDVWVMAEQTPAFDYGTAIPRSRLYQVRSVPGVAWADSMFLGWNDWQRPDGRRVNVTLIGLGAGSIGGPWRMKSGRVEDVHLPDSVIVDELFMDLLGVGQLGDEAEMFGQRAVVRGFSQEIRSFTASPVVFTSVDTAIAYDKRYRSDEITYVLIKCAPGYSADEVAQAIRQQVPYVEALTTYDFAWRTVNYWMMETGAGATVVLTALLGLVVSTVVISQTLFTVTQEHLHHYATLLALGFRRGQMLYCVVLQALLLSGLGIVLGSGGFFVVSYLTARTPIPVETTPEVFAGVVGVSLACSLLGAMLSLKAVQRIDPVRVFRL